MTGDHQPSRSGSGAGTLGTPPGTAYVGYRWRGKTALRVPSGTHPQPEGPAADSSLAHTVLADRLTATPSGSLVAAFRREWIEPLADGEFFWPVESVDAWLASPRPARHEAPHPVPSRPAAVLEGAL